MLALLSIVSRDFSPSHNTVAIRMRKSMTESREGSTRAEGEGEAVQEQELGELRSTPLYFTSHNVPDPPLNPLDAVAVF